MTVARTDQSPMPARGDVPAAPDAAAPSGRPTLAPRYHNERPIGRLVLSHVTKDYEGSDVPAVEDMSLTCEPGEFLVVVGPSGCGKTTLLNLAAGVIRPDSGSVTIDGHRVRKPGPDRAMVFQDHGLFPWLTAEQNIEFGLKMTGMGGRQRRERVAEALHMVHLSHSATQFVHELSGGMRQRVAIARALVMDPALLLMDEPFAALDAQTRTLMHQQLQDLWLQTRKSILFVTHSVGEAVRLADRIIILHSHPGRIRSELRVQLPHPRNFDSPEVGELVRRVRREIEDEVNRVNAKMADEFWKPEAPAGLSADDIDLGGGI